MDAYGWVAVGTLAVTIFLFVTRLIPLEATALSIPVVLAATGAIDARAALSGFGNHAVIAIGGVFILGEGLRESGVASLMGRVLQKLGGGSGTRTLLVIMVPTCLLSAFMSSAATVAVFMPAVMALARRSGIPVSRLMMPLGFAAVMGGTLTLIGTTPNLILGEEILLRSGGSETLGMFEFAKVGAPAAVIGILYMALIGYRLLPKRTVEDRLKQADLPEELSRNYGFRQNLFRMAVLAQSKIVGKSIREAKIGRQYDLEVLQVHRHPGRGTKYLDPVPDLVFAAGDEIYLEGGEERAWKLAEEQVLQFGVAGPQSLGRILRRGMTLAEVTLSPHSQVFGSTFKDQDFRKRTGLSVTAVWRRGEPIRKGLGDLQLELGDAFLVAGSPEAVAKLSKNRDYVVVSTPDETEDARKAPLAFLILLAALIPPILEWVPLAVSAIGGALMMVACRCISLEGARRAVDFRVLFLIIGTIPLGIAMDERGVAKVITDGMLAIEPVMGEAGVLLALFLAASLLSMTCNNGAAAVILAPVAFRLVDPGNPLALDMDMSKVFLAVAFGASCVYMLPFGNQCNLMVMGPGGYTPKHFLKAGAVLTVLMAAVTVTLLTLL